MAATEAYYELVSGVKVNNSKNSDQRVLRGKNEKFCEVRKH